MKINEESIILGIESSCDETAVAVLKGRQILSNIISSQIEIHKRYGGVVPEIASRNHTMAIPNVVKKAVSDAGITLADIDAIAVTYGAGLLGALLVGVSYAKALSYALGIPLIAVNHIVGHIAANYITHKELEPPFMCALASGGHTAIIKVNDYNTFKVLGTTLDDAIGEAFDKVGRLLGLSYPGGAKIDKLAKKGKVNIEFPRSYRNEKHYNFSYSGIKTAVMNYINKSKQSGKEYNPADVACSFQSVAVSMLVDNAVRAAKEYNIDKIVIAGGVGANSELRAQMTAKAEGSGIKVYYPSLELCTDNGAMIACAGYYMAVQGNGIVGLDLDANASLRLSDL